MESLKKTKRKTKYEFFRLILPCRLVVSIKMRYKVPYGVDQVCSCSQPQCLGEMNVKPMLFVLTQKTMTSRYTIFAFLDFFYSEMIKESHEVSEEIIWNDVPSSELKNKFMFETLMRLS